MINIQKSPDAGGQSGLDTWMIEDLEMSGLTPDKFTIEPLKTELELETRLGITDITHKDGNQIKIIDIGGYWIPYPNVPGYYRLKLRQEITDREENGIRYLSPIDEKGFGNPAYIMKEVADLGKTYCPDKHLFITEGEKKAAKVTLQGFPCIGLSGVWNFKDSENEFLPELDCIVWKDRAVYIVFDSDETLNFEVKRAEVRLAVQLINRGAMVNSVRLPNAEVGI